MSDKLLFTDLSQAQSDAIKGGQGPTQVDPLQVGGDIKAFNYANNNFTNSAPLLNFGKILPLTSPTE